MDIMDFTAEEENLIAIYAEGTREETIAAITEALPHMGAEFTALAERAATKLAAMTDGEFAEAAFTLADDDTERGEP
jgi:hypothetical protein